MKLIRCDLCGHLGNEFAESFYRLEFYRGEFSSAEDQVYHWCQECYGSHKEACNETYRELKEGADSDRP
jgi:hypothetical protein